MLSCVSLVEENESPSSVCQCAGLRAYTLMIVTLLGFAAALMEIMLLLMNVHLYNSIVRRAEIHGNETSKKEKRRLDVN